MGKKFLVSLRQLMKEVAVTHPYFVRCIKPNMSLAPDDFNGAQLKAVCVEAGMLALRREGTEIQHEDFMEGVTQVQAKKKASLAYYA